MSLVKVLVFYEIMLVVLMFTKALNKHPEQASMHHSVGEGLLETSRTGISALAILVAKLRGL